MKKILSALTALLLSSFTHAVTIDIMVVYDNKAKQHLAEQNISEQLFANGLINKITIPVRNGGMDVQFRLVHHMSINYDNVAGTDGRNMRQDLANIKNNAMVKNARAQHNADLVHLVIDINRPRFGSWVAGIASTPCYFSNLQIAASCSRDHAYSVGSIQDLESSSIARTMIHEIGHNLGADHAREQDPNAFPPFEPYGFGYYFNGTDGQKYNTIMAYRNSSRGAPYFSSPCNTYQGTAVGRANYADNVRALQQTVGIVANYFGSTQSYTIPSSECSVSSEILLRDSFE